MKYTGVVVSGDTPQNTRIIAYFCERFLKQAYLGESMDVRLAVVGITLTLTGGTLMAMLFYRMGINRTSKQRNVPATLPSGTEEQRQTWQRFHREYQEGKYAPFVAEDKSC